MTTATATPDSTIPAALPTLADAGERAAVLAPYAVDAARRRISAAWMRATSTPRSKVAVLAGSAGTAAALALVGRRGAAVAALAPAVALVGPIVRERASRSLRAWTVPRRIADARTLTPAWQSLVELGVSRDVAERVQEAAAARGTYRVGRFDQRNRLCSDIGDIPGFDVQVVTHDDFEPRLWHRVELVVVRGVLGVRKTYRYGVSYAKEAAALDALRDVPGVPRILEAHPRRRVLTQTFLHGVNLATLMGARGFCDREQLQLDNDRVAWPDWHAPDRAPALRAVALSKLDELADHAFRDALISQLEAMHRAGVVFRDVKYGNVLVRDGVPVWCDFDGCRVYTRRGVGLMRDRIADHDKVNFWFGTDLPTERGVRALLEAHGAHDLASLVLDGAARDVEDAGWPAVARSCDVPVVEREVVVLGGATGLPAAELARRGARVWLRAATPRVAEQAQALAAWFDLTDDRPMALDVGTGPVTAEVAVAPSALAELDDAGVDAALDGVGAARVVLASSADRSALDRLSEALAARAYVTTQLDPVAGRSAPVLVGRRPS